MNFVFMAKLEKGFTAPAKVTSPELGKVMGGSLEEAAIPAVFNYLLANLPGGAGVFGRGEAGFEAGRENAGSLGKIRENRRHKKPEGEEVNKCFDGGECIQLIV